jgi:capsular exopolysaccharide synthesis family protein
MDRLEKALMKARELRETVQPSSAAPVAVPPPAPAHQPEIQLRTAPGNNLTKQVTVDDDALERARIVARLNRNANADIFRILRTKVLQAMNRSNLRTIAITSANYGDGKTTVAVNLALSLALDLKQTVLLVDLDLRSPSIHEILGITPTVGLSDYFLRNAPVPECLVKPAFDRLVVLPISEPLDNSSEMLGSPKMAALAHELKTRYDDRIVIYDMPPLLSQDDTIAFLPHVDGVLLVVRDGKTQTEDLNQCMNALGNANLLGTVLNNSTVGA